MPKLYQLRTCLLLFVTCLLTARPVVAQVPTEDATTNKWWGLYFVQRVLHTYTAVRDMRDESLRLARQMIQQTRRVTRLRQKYEDRAVGEAGRLGDHVPDWRDYANYCDVSIKGVSACNIERTLRIRYENILHNHFYVYRSELFRDIREASRQLDVFLGRKFTQGIEAAFAAYGSAPEAVYLERAPLLVAQAEQSASLEEAARHLNIVLDSVALAEISNQSLSSGRAREISAHLAYVEAIVELEVARAKLQLLDTKIIAAADQLRRTRFDNLVRFVSLQ